MCKQCVTKENTKLSDYKHCLMNNGKIMRSQQTFKSERHVVSTIPMKKLLFKIMMIKGRITTHAYGKSICKKFVKKICKNELLAKVKRIE